MLVKNVMQLCLDSEYYKIVNSTTTTTTPYKNTFPHRCVYIHSTANCQSIKNEYLYSFELRKLT